MSYVAAIAIFIFGCVPVLIPAAVSAGHALIKVRQNRANARLAPTPQHAV